MKKCVKCGELKPLKSFTKQKRGYLGVHSTCNKCRVIINRKYAHTKVSIEKRKEYNKKRLDKIRTYGISIKAITLLGLKLALEIYDKYDRKCAYCDSEYDLTVHHIDRKGRNYINKGLKPNNNIENLIILCRKCHGSIHGKQHKIKK